MWHFELHPIFSVYLNKKMFQLTMFFPQVPSSSTPRRWSTSTGRSRNNEIDCSARHTSSSSWDHRSYFERCNCGQSQEDGCVMVPCCCVRSILSYLCTILVMGDFLYITSKNIIFSSLKFFYILLESSKRLEHHAIWVLRTET